MRITKLDGLRGIFSLMIVFHHYPDEYLPDFLSNIFLVRAAYTFVDFFFVLSGFVIAYNYHSLSNIQEFSIYMKKRFIRIYPLLFFTLIVFTIKVVFQYAFFSHDLNEVEPLSQLILKFFDTGLMLNSTPLLGDTMAFNGQSWSISSEMISYALFGLMIVLISKKYRVISFIAVIITSCAILYALGNFFASGNYGFLRGFVSFNLGYLVWEINKLNFRVNDKFEYLIPIFLAVILYYLDLFGKTSDSGVIFGMTTIPLFFSLSILILLKTNGLLSKFLDTRPLQFLGNISFSVYLNHSVLLSVGIYAFQIFNIENTNTNRLLTLLFLIAIILIYSNYTYKYIELKLGKKIKSFLFK